MSERVTMSDREAYSPVSSSVSLREIGRVSPISPRACIAQILLPL